MKFWNFSKTGTNGVLTLYGDISNETWFGDEITPKVFRDDLDALGNIETLDVYINSPGGDVFAGISIYNIIKNCAATVTAHVDGLAASAASVICMAAQKIVMPKNATMMIHEVSSIAIGNKRDMRALADVLERTDNQLSEIYADRCGKTPEECLKLMEAETWMTGSEALEMGLCDEVEDNVEIAACADPNGIIARYKHAPTLLLKTDNGGESQPVQDKPAGADDTALDEQRMRFCAMKTRIYTDNERM